MRIPLLLLAVISCSFAELIEFGKLPSLENKTILVPKNSQIFVIADGSYDHEYILRSIQIKETASNHTEGAFELSHPDLTGKLRPFVTSNDTDIIFTYFYGTDYNIPGYIYIAKSDDSPGINAYVQQNEENLEIRATGTNVFFPLNIESYRIPVVFDLKIEQGSSVKAFVGIPENGQQVFDSAAIKSTSFYDQLEFPVKSFYFSSSSRDRISYIIATTSKNTDYAVDSLPTAGLLMTRYYWDKVHASQSTFSFSNNNNANINVNIHTYVHNEAQTDYFTNFTITSNGQEDEVVTCNSLSEVCDFQRRTPLKQIVVNSGGQYAIQYAIGDV